MKKILISVIITALFVGGVAFYSGMKYEQSKMPFRRFSQQERLQIQQRIRGQNGGFATGEIIAKDEKSITIKLPNGGSKIIFYSSDTEIGKFTKGIPEDLEIGKRVTVFGKANDDGSISAQSIQLRPEINFSQ